MSIKSALGYKLLLFVSRSLSFSYVRGHVHGKRERVRDLKNLGIRFRFGFCGFNNVADVRRGARCGGRLSTTTQGYERCRMIGVEIPAPRPAQPAWQRTFLQGRFDTSSSGEQFPISEFVHLTNSRTAGAGGAHLAEVRDGPRSDRGLTLGGGAQL